MSTLRPLEELKTLTLYQMTADEMEFLRRSDPTAYNAIAEPIDTESGEMQPGERRIYENGRKV
jgi:hypothetical protein